MATLTTSRLIPSSPFHLFDELVHKNLQVWSKELADSLREIDPFAAEISPNATVFLNQAALVAALQGKMEEAFDLCHVQVEWLLHRTPTRRMNADDFMTFFQPWINIGRLHTIQGNYEAAALHFGMIERIQEADEIDLMYDSIKSSQVKAFLKDEKYGQELDAFLRSNYIDGMFSILMKKFQFREALEFLQEQGTYFNHPAFEEIKNEFAVLILEKMGEHKLTIEKIRSFKPEKPISKLIFLYHLALNYYLIGDMESAYKYAVRLTGYLQKAARKSNFLDLKKLILMTGKLCHEMDLNKNSFLMNQLGFKLSEELEDQRYALLYALAIYESFGLSQEQREHWGSILRKLFATNDYIIPGTEKYLNTVEKEAVAHDCFQDMYSLVMEKFSANKSNFKMTAS